MTELRLAGMVWKDNIFHLFQPEVKKGLFSSFSSESGSPANDRICRKVISNTSLSEVISEWYYNSCKQNVADGKSHPQCYLNNNKSNMVKSCHAFIEWQHTNGENMQYTFSIVLPVLHYHT